MPKKKDELGIQPFEEDDDDIDSDESEEVEELEMAEKKNAKNRKKDEDEAVEEENDDVDDDDDDETDDDEEDDDEDEDDTPVGFAPFIIHEDSEWDLEDVIDESEPGETLYFYRAPTEESKVARWYKLEPISVGELPTE